MARYDDINILNLGSGKGCSIAELAEMIREGAGWKGRFVYDTSRPDGAICKIIDIAKMQSVLDGWSPRMALREGIRKTIQWWNTHRDSFKDATTTVEAQEV
jgi:GDP-L-fucose synthase